MSSEERIRRLERQVRTLAVAMVLMVIGAGVTVFCGAAASPPTPEKPQDLTVRSLKVVGDGGEKDSYATISADEHFIGMEMFGRAPSESSVVRLRKENWSVRFVGSIGTRSVGNGDSSPWVPVSMSPNRSTPQSRFLTPYRGTPQSYRKPKK